MRDADFRSVAMARLRWLSPAEGGRRSVPPGPIFAATARVGSDPGVPPVSIAIRYRGDVLSFGAEFDADVAFLALELVKDVLAPGAHLAVMEGPRQVAQGQITQVLSEPG